MSAPAPLHAFFGGVGLAIPVYDLLTLNGNVLGISGFIHRGIRGSSEALLSLSGLFLGGVAIGLLPSSPPEILDSSLPSLILSGFLVGVGTKLSNGCTSGHMIAGLSRFSPRSAFATATFFLSAVVTTHFVHSDLAPINTIPYDWSFSGFAWSLILLQAAPEVVSVALHLFAPKPLSSSEGEGLTRPLSFFRHIAALATTFQFSLALRLSDLSSPSRVIRFLATPFSLAFDPSLAFLAVGAMPLSVVLYRYYRGDEQPRLGGPWQVPTNRMIDYKLSLGAALFGVGWAIQGICPGPAIVNLGTSVVQNNTSSISIVYWLGSVVVGGLVASVF